jgi:predicted RNase H-like HicB family nuclease
VDVLLILQFTVEKNGSDTHVVIIQWAFSDAGSTPAASTINLMEARYTVSLKKTDEGISVWVPGLPGCWSQGSTEEEALANIRDALFEYLSVVRKLAADGDVREVVLSV